MKNAKDFENYKRTLARHKVIMLATVGSTLLGLEQDAESDVDEMGICLETPTQLLGFAPFEHEIYRTAEDRTGRCDAPSEAGDIDLTLYGLRKFVRMALSGNPNVIAMLYIPEKMCSVYTQLARELQLLAPAFASKEVGKAFLGYMKAQKLRLQGLSGQMGVNRAELVKRYGYDVKYAMHAVRLAIQGYFFMRAWKLKFPLPADDLTILRRVRNGDLSLSEVADQLEAYEPAIKDLVSGNYVGLPDKPDYAKIEQWLVNVYQREWYENKTSSQQQGSTTDSQRQDSGAGGKNGEEIRIEMPF